jgi:K+-sensing histidine kinase KdpD
MNKKKQSDIHPSPLILHPLLQGRAGGYVLAVLGVAAATVLLRPFSGQINPTTVALALLLVVLFVATLRGSRPALVASALGMLCLNFFFLPPVHTFTIADPDNWVALAAFLITAVTAGQLSVRAERRAAEAEAGRREIERLYRELSEAFERASQAEALKRSERLKSALLDAVTHDLRTPLTAIKASATTLLDDLRAGAQGLGPAGRREMLEVIDEEADRLNRFVEGLVELARIEAGELHLRRRREPVEEIVAAALERAAPLTRGRAVEVSLAEGLPAAHVDARAVAEVVYALLDNAAKYSPPGSPVRVSAQRSAGATISLAVEDEGGGVPAALRERVFDKFFRAMRDGDTGARGAPSGTGMGLAIARGIVEAHGGRIRIEDGRDGRGCRVVVSLPTGAEEATATHNFVKDEGGEASSDE